MDAALLNLSGVREHVPLFQDADLLPEASSRVRLAGTLSGLIYAHQLNATVGQCGESLELIAKACVPADLSGLVVCIPIR